MIPIRDTIPSRHVPVMNLLLIAANVLVFLYQLTLPGDAAQQVAYLFGIVPARFTHPDWASFVGFPADSFWPFLTSMFLHGGLFHIAANLWTLWIFGDNVEDRMGPFRYLAFYLLCGVSSGVVHWLTHPNSTMPTIGASGAIAGVLGAYLVLYPRSRILILVPVLIVIPFFFELPAFFYLGFWFLSQLFNGTFSLGGTAAAEGIAWWAHIGGFLTGLLLFPLFLGRSNGSAPPPERHLVFPQLTERPGARFERW